VSQGKTLILSGGGDFTDPWHPFAETSARLAELLGELEQEVTVSDVAIDSIVNFPADAPDLLVITTTRWRPFGHGMQWPGKPGPRVPPPTA
jgi:hypothetical protein